MQSQGTTSYEKPLNLKQLWLLQHLTMSKIVLPNESEDSIRSESKHRNFWLQTVVMDATRLPFADDQYRKERDDAIKITDFLGQARKLYEAICALDKRLRVFSLEVEKEGLIK